MKRDHRSMSEEAFQAARALALAAALGLALLLEWSRPHVMLRPSWGTNLGLWAVDVIVIGVVCGACGWAAAQWASRLGLGLLAAIGAPSWLAASVGVVALDAVAYFWHRANHRVPVLWRFHRVHHADPGFHTTTALRFHPGELLLALSVRLVAIVALGVPPAGVLAFELVFGAANLLVHGNFDLPARLERPLQRLLVSPALHRLHHSREQRELDSNFGTIFSCWDRWLATLTPTDSTRSIETGVPGLPRGARLSLARALAQPFARTLRP
jgi:sterol desaturase/sphingolipid hydroxylase (fatty acid hydroxylase superfamily)